MADQELRIECPCCKAVLIVDAASGGVIKSTPHKEAPTSLESFLKSDKNRQSELSQRFAEAKLKEDAKMDLLNKKFEWAKKNKDKLPDVPKPGIQWD